jgi:uncharacterized protein (TIGR04255 family)
VNSENGSRLEFADPPVVSVSLTVFFEPVESLQASHLSSLRERWKDHYPNLAELPPLRPRNRGGNEAALVPLGAWPCPYVMFSSEDDQSSIAIQSDRFIRSWSFKADEKAVATYPGFEKIREDLVQHFEHFKETLRAELDQNVVITGSECDYLNLLDNEMPPEQLMVGVTTKWAAPVDTTASSGITYGGVRLHLCDTDELEGCSVTLRLDVDSDGPMLGIESAFELADDDAVADVDLGGLDRAHEKLIETFLEYTSNEMQKNWGRQA